MFCCRKICRTNRADTQVRPYANNRFGRRSWRGRHENRAFSTTARGGATMGCLMPGRFFLGVGTGENLNEHIVGEGWPSATVRREMLREAVEVIRELWRGESVDHYGEYFSVEDARIYSLPEQLPPIYVAASGEKMAQIAGEIGDGDSGTSAEAGTVRKVE